MKAGMSNLERLVVGGVEEGMLEHGMTPDAARRIGAFGFLIARGVGRNFEKGFPLHLSDCYTRVVYIPDCSIRVS